MRVAGLAAVLAVGVFTVIVSAPHAQRRQIHCGSERWAVKTLSDGRRNLIYFRPRPTTIDAINARPMPRPTPQLRSRGYERHVWRLVAQITEYKLERDQTIRMILFDKDAYMIAEMPAAGCLRRTSRLRRTMINTRRIFEERCGAASNQWRSLGAVVEISGVGFWGFPHGQRGHAKNYAELHPVTRLRYIAGCA